VKRLSGALSYGALPTEPHTFEISQSMNIGSDVRQLHWDWERQGAAQYRVGDGEVDLPFRLGRLASPNHVLLNRFTNKIAKRDRSRTFERAFFGTGLADTSSVVAEMPYASSL
jgi:hypothetical protein